MPSAPGTEQMSRAFRNVLHLFTRQQCPPSSFCGEEERQGGQWSGPRRLQASRRRGRRRPCEQQLDKTQRWTSNQEVTSRRCRGRSDLNTFDAVGSESAEQKVMLLLLSTLDPFELTLVSADVLSGAFFVLECGGDLERNVSLVVQLRREKTFSHVQL